MVVVKVAAMVVEVGMHCLREVCSAERVLLVGKLRKRREQDDG